MGLVRLIAFIAVGALAGFGLREGLAVDVPSLVKSPAYDYFAYLLLAIGLYAATSGIDLRQAKSDRRIIVLAVTVGVILKAAIIGGSLAFFFDDPLFLILGVAVAQIDPLSVAALMGDKRMSPRARTILAAWSSFDDPFTVVLSIYAAAVAVTTFGIGSGNQPSGDPVRLYAENLIGNLALAGAVWLLWRFWLRRRDPLVQYFLLAILFVVAALLGWMLAIAIIGLFLRPEPIQRILPQVTNVALLIAAFALGLLLVDQIDLKRGIVLGAAAYLAQAIVSPLLTRGMPKADQWHLAAAQQNGITAIILALTLEIQFDGVVAVVAPAIITANVLHFVTNKLIDRHDFKEPAVSQTSDAHSAPGYSDQSPDSPPHDRAPSPQ